MTKHTRAVITGNTCSNTFCFLFFFFQRFLSLTKRQSVVFASFVSSGCSQTLFSSSSKGLSLLKLRFWLVSRRVIIFFPLVFIKAGRDGVYVGFRLNKKEGFTCSLHLRLPLPACGVFLSRPLLSLVDIMICVQEKLRLRLAPAGKDLFVARVCFNAGVQARQYRRREDMFTKKKRAVTLHSLASSFLLSLISPAWWDLNGRRKREARKENVNEIVCLGKARIAGGFLARFIRRLSLGPPARAGGTLEEEKKQKKKRKKKRKGEGLFFGAWLQT